jgi:hypothetical protein
MTPWDEASQNQPIDPTARAIDVKRRYQDDLMRKANVVGVGVGVRRAGGQPTDDIAVVVMVSRKLPIAQLDPEDVVPSQIDGVPLDVQETGEISAW